MEKLELWDKVKQVPKEYLKAITGGRLKGKSDINPQWRMQELTAQFGPCGIGWKYSVDKLWLETGSEDQIAAFSSISLYVKNGGAWSDPIPGIGGSMFVERESKGPHTNDEAYKMATTDALSVACKALGFGADVYFGRWDGSKYNEGPAPTSDGTDQRQPPDRRPPPQRTAAPASEQSSAAATAAPATNPRPTGRTMRGRGTPTTSAAEAPADDLPWPADAPEDTKPSKAPPLPDKNRLISKEEYLSLNTAMKDQKIVAEKMFDWMEREFGKRDPRTLSASEYGILMAAITNTPEIVNQGIGF